ncbi:hypothetical protein BH11PLA2_BH11PLA2_45840 [soil metagenome]
MPSLKLKPPATPQAPYVMLNAQCPRWYCGGDLTFDPADGSIRCKACVGQRRPAPYKPAKAAKRKVGAR